MVSQWACAFGGEVAGLLQGLDKGWWILDSKCQVINVDSHMFAGVAIGVQPDVRFSTA